jgi:hypothetical protein
LQNIEGCPLAFGDAGYNQTSDEEVIDREHFRNHVLAQKKV